MPFTLNGAAAAHIAPLVKDAMRDLLTELKHPGGGREGLNRLM
jgi:hypothetical protein